MLINLYYNILLVLLYIRMNLNLKYSKPTNFYYFIVKK